MWPLHRRAGGEAYPEKPIGALSYEWSVFPQSSLRFRGLSFRQCMTVRLSRVYVESSLGRARLHDWSSGVFVGREGSGIALQVFSGKKEKTKPEMGFSGMRIPVRKGDKESESKQHQDKKAVGMTKQQTKLGEDTR